MNVRTAGWCFASFLAGMVLMLRLVHASVPAPGVPGIDTRVIAITPAQHRALDQAHELDRWLDDELLFREGLRRGYALDDLIVRREVQRRTRAALLAEQAAPPPDDATLQAYMRRHAGQYQAPAVYSFEQIYLSRAVHGERLEADSAGLGARLKADPRHYAGLGDPFPNGARRTAAGADRIVADFGLAFAQSVTRLPADGAWHGPVASALGAHWVRLDRVDPGQPLSLAQARTRVAADYGQWQQQQVLRRALDALRGQYRVVDDPGAASGVPRPMDEDDK